LRKSLFGIRKRVTETTYYVKPSEPVATVLAGWRCIKCVNGRGRKEGAIKKFNLADPSSTGEGLSSSQGEMEVE